MTDQDGGVTAYQYQYDLAGNRTRVTLAGGNYIEYNYDSIHQLTSEVKTEVDNGYAAYFTRSQGCICGEKQTQLY